MFFSIRFRIRATWGRPSRRFGVPFPYVTVGLLLLSGWTGTAVAGPHQQYEDWRAQDVQWIRAGIGKPQDHHRLKSKGTLLVLDGDRVVQTIKPGDSFFVVSSRQRKGAARYWVQVKTGPHREKLEAMAETLARNHPEMAFKVVKLKKDHALRGGPFLAKKEAEQVRRSMVNLGFKDAYLIHAKTRYPFQWVNRHFDKLDLRAQEVGLVNPNPEQPIHLDGVGYRGILRLRIVNGKIKIINVLPMETYLRGVVPTELGPNAFPELEALKAQAVAARTYALKNLRRFEKYGYDICDTPACQAYEGTKNEHPLSDQAVAETAGLVLYHGDTLIDALYTSTCGGMTDDVTHVFPGRNEPYLKSKSSYLAQFQAWQLPLRPAPGIRTSLGEDLTVRAYLYGVRDLPERDGPLDAKTLKAITGDLAWIMGDVPPLPKSSNGLSHRAFWEFVADYPLIVAVEKHQFQDADFVRPLSDLDLPSSLQPLAAFLLRYELVDGDALNRIADDSPITVREALTALMTLAVRFGPEPEWKRYKIRALDNNVLTLQRGSKQRTLNLGGIKHYLTERGDKLSFREQPRMEELDRVYLLDGPFSRDMIRIQENFKVASVDRFSAYDVWMEKKSVSELERRARRYVRGIRGIRDVKVLRRSDTGRVTELEYITDAGNFRVKGLNIRWSLGVRENLIDLIPSYRKGRLVHLTVIGRGWGHGVGMSQVGAFGLAAQGWAFDRILTHYYDGVAVEPFQGKTKADPNAQPVPANQP